MHTTPTTEALATITKVVDILPLLAAIPARGLLPGGFKLDTSGLGEGFFAIEYAYPNGYTPGRVVHISSTPDTNQTHPICISRTWISITGSIETIKTTNTHRHEAKTEIAAALEWLHTP